MGGKELRRELAVRRIWEGVIATVVGGLILWSVTSSMSQPASHDRTDGSRSGSCHSARSYAQWPRARRINAQAKPLHRK